MELLLEINTEEMPPSHVEEGLNQLESGLAAELRNQGLVNSRGSCGKIRTFGTSRRLIVYADLIERQQDREEIITGPPRAAAFTKDGQPTQAAHGFARSRGVSVEDLQIFATDKGEYVALKKMIQGKAAPEIIQAFLPDLIQRLSFPKMMKWGERNFRFSRPIRHILCLCQGKTLAFEVAGVKSTGYTFGHRLFSPVKIGVADFREYREELHRNKVIIDRETRKSRIEKQMQKKLAPHAAACYPDEQLLNKLAMDVEYPYVFLGTFPDKYLKLPLEVLSTAMKMGQNLFSVVKGRKQIPMFLGVADACDDSRALVRKGNERVLKARLEDARFFWEQDIQIPMKERSEELSRVVFQEKLGSYDDKSGRIKKLVTYLADRLEASEEKKWASEAAGLCKIDLVTEMVREFPSLQGKAGGLYARKEGYPTGIWKAVYEHYKPVTLEDTSPSTLTGALLAICDKLDSVVGTLGLGVEVSGSKDPYGLRRNAQGICTVILDKKLSFSFGRLLDKVISVYGEQLELPKDTLKTRCLEFFQGRLQHIFERQGFRYDLINAALASGIDNIYHTYLRLKALDSFKDSSSFEPMILIAKRVNNILKGQPAYKVNSGLFVEKDERGLYTSFKIIRDNIQPLIAKGDFVKAQQIVFRIRSCTNSFFDNVMVMAEDNMLRRNRLALLQAVSRLLIQVADYSRIVVQG
jgi:glycyl-tRNA synthetase beta chain